MNEQHIVLDNTRFTTLIIDPTVVSDERKIYCMYCGDQVFAMNRKFAVASDGAMPYGGEIPLDVFRFTKMCPNTRCKHYYICYLDGKGKDL